MEKKKKENLDIKSNKKHIFRKIILGLLIIVLLLFIVYIVNNFITNMKINKFKENFNSIEKEKISYVFVEINPSLVLTIKDGKVSDVGCLNDDCIEIYNDIDVKGKYIDESIDNLYNLSKEKGYNVSNGVKVKTADNIIIESKDYITIEYIDNTKEKELLNDVKNNEEIKNIDNDNYYSKLWEELKKDSNYDDVYTCNMNNKELECYIILETGINKESDYDILGTEEKLEELFGGSQSKVYNTLKKFNFDVRDNKIYINDIEFGYVPLFTFNNTPYKNVLTAEKIDILDNDICHSGYAEYKNGICQVKDGVYIIPLEKVNLVNPISAINNMITLSNGLTENTLKNYELTNELAKSQREWEERVDRCLPVIKSKGYVYKNNNFPCCDGTNYADGCYSCTGREHDARYCNTIHDATGSYEACSTLLLIFNNLEPCD